MDIIQHSPLRHRIANGICVGKEQKMTRDEALQILDTIPTISEQVDALEMAIKALENIGHLKDRPCSVCEFHKENGCCKWTCVFTDRLFGDMRGAE